jgi:hypothetical protein
LVVLLWQAPHLVVVRPGKKHETMFSNVYRYAAGTSPTTDIRTMGRPSSDRTIEQTMAGQPLPAVAMAILDELDLTLADLSSPRRHIG